MLKIFKWWYRTINMVRTFGSSLSSGDNFEMILHLIVHHRVEFSLKNTISEFLDSSDNVLISLGYSHGDSNLILNDGHSASEIDTTGVQFIASTTYSFHLVNIWK